MKLYNTLTRKKDEFIPLTPNEVKIYACGPTVYNFFHIGNARPFVVFDTLRKYFEYKGMKVTFVQNFTDIDDKMINRANSEGITVKELADRFIAEYFVDAKGLGIKDATIHPKATESVDAIIEIVKSLIEKGYAYEVEGDVYFSTKKFKEYGKLSQQSLEDLESGARIEVDERKKDPMDFAVWKSQKPKEPAWDSPWGLGRPGWHIECSAMIKKNLGETIDIHTGGQDLIFPHHENEIAQSEAANGKPFVRYWLHNGHINVDNKKMSKSSNNFFTIRDIVERFDYQIIRFFILSAHYRSPINFSDELLEQAANGFERIINAINNLEHLIKHAESKNITEDEISKFAEFSRYRGKFIEAMDDDLNTADAISVIFELVREVNTNVSKINSVEFLEKSNVLINELLEVLGLKVKLTEEISKEVLELAEMRQIARKDKKWQESDEIRDKLKDLGYVVEDTSNGPKLKRI